MRKFKFIEENLLGSESLMGDEKASEMYAHFLDIGYLPLSQSEIDDVGFEIFEDDIREYIESQREDSESFMNRNK